jgi:hypothetical protein
VTDSRILVFKAGITLLLVFISAAILFVPVVEGSEEVKAMFVLLTGIAVRDFFGATQEDKRMAELKQALSPDPPSSYVVGDEE